MALIYRYALKLRPVPVLIHTSSNFFQEVNLKFNKLRRSTSDVELVAMYVIIRVCCALFAMHKTSHAFERIIFDFGSQVYFFLN